MIEYRAFNFENNQVLNVEKFLFKKIEIWAVIAIFLVLFPLVGYWGFSIPTHKVFPYAAIQEISAWLKGVDEGEKLSLQQKIEADVGTTPAFTKPI